AMRLVQGFAIAVFTLMGATPSFAQVGDVADDQGDLDRRRTPSYSRSGNLNTEVEMFNAGSGSDDCTYTTRIEYEFVIQCMGTRAGTRVLEVPAEFFTPEFKEELRTTGHYESEQFKIDHQGFADARTLDGNFYPNCDVIR